VAVKQGIWNSAVQTMLPDSARAAIRRTVAEALRSRHRILERPTSPVRVELKYTTSLFADIAEGIPGVERVDGTTVAFTVADYPAAYRMIRVLYKHLQP
jgi:D-amino peptidase